MASLDAVRWVRNLPDVGEPLLDRCDSIKDKLQRAAGLELQALAIKRQALQEIGELMDRVEHRYSDAEIKRAQRQ